MGRPQEFFGAGMWSENATSAHHPPVFVLEERHADWTRWIELHRYPTREIAEEHLERLVEAGGGPGRGTGREAPDRGRRPDPRLTSGE
jgi:hypothetical protein